MKGGFEAIAVCANMVGVATKKEQTSGHVVIGRDQGDMRQVMAFGPHTGFLDVAACVASVKPKRNGQSLSFIKKAVF